MTRAIRARLLATAIGCAVITGLAPTLAAAASRPAPRPAPAAASAAVGPRPALAATAAALYAPQTRQLLYGVNPDRRQAIASTTKLMTALIVLQHVHRLSTVFTQNDYYPAAADSQIGLVPGERMSVHDLLEALMLPSADDAAEDLAFNVGHGSVARFVAMMNAEARVLGLTHTHYSTPVGLDTPGNYSSASDLVRLAQYDLTHSPFFAKVVALKGAVVHRGDMPLAIVNRNDLVSEYPWIDGVKTGHTLQAGYVLVASAHRNGLRLISAVLGTTSEHERDASTMALLDFGYSRFELRTPVRARQVLARPTVRDRPGVHAAVLAARAFARVVPRGGPLRIRVHVPAQLAGPMPAGAVVGTATVLDGRRALGQVPLVLARALPAVSSLTVAARFVTRPLTLLVIAAAVVAGGLMLRSVRRRRRSGGQGGTVETA